MKFPKDDATTHWTAHVKNKMIQYSLSESRIRRVIKNGIRREEGVAPNTIALMQRNDTPKRKEEIWVMLQESNNATKRESKKLLVTERVEGLSQYFFDNLRRPNITIISAWRYPGVTRPGRPIPIPEDTLAEILDMI